MTGELFLDLGHEALLGRGIGGVVFHTSTLVLNTALRRFVVPGQLLLQLGHEAFFLGTVLCSGFQARRFGRCTSKYKKILQDLLQISLYTLED